MTAIVDYGVGNLFSVVSSLRAIGAESVVTGDADVIYSADRVLLPGVGAFEDAAAKLRASGLVPVLEDVVEKGRPVLGICLGMQLLFDKSHEFGEHEGLGLIPGDAMSLTESLGAMGRELKVPHIGWNSLDIHKSDCPLLKYVKPGDFVYYIHSYHVVCPEKYVVASSEYGVDVTGMVQRENVFGAQFHPEKSGDVGLGVLRAFTELK